jgi:hypothetical protein
MDQIYQVTLREKQNKLKDYMRDCEMMLGTEKLCEDNIQKLSNLLKTLDQVHKAIDAIQVGYTIIPDDKFFKDAKFTIFGIFKGLPTSTQETLKGHLGSIKNIEHLG